MPDRVTVVVLVAREPEALGRWHAGVAAALARAGLDHEFVYAIGDRCPKALAETDRLRAADPSLRSVLLSHWFDRVAAVQRAVTPSAGDRVLVLAPDDGAAPDDLPRLLAALADHDVVLARREGCGDAAVDRLCRRLFATPLRDPACRTRAFRRRALAAVADRTVPYALMPLFASWQGFLVDEMPVRRTDGGARRYGTALRSASYLVGVAFLRLLLGFAKRPLQLFGTAGALAFAGGLAITLPLIVSRLAFGESLADEPRLMPGLLLTALGVQCVAVGLLAELLVFARNRVIRDYVVERMVE